MTVKRIAGIIAVLPLLLAMRDPFQPVEDRCQIAMLGQWRYQGMVSSPERQTGLLRDASGRWHRVAQGTTLLTGWQVTEITVGELRVMTGSGCEPAYWRWMRKGIKNETMDSFTAARPVVVDMPGGKESHGIADGR